MKTHTQEKCEVKAEREVIKLPSDKPTKPGEYFEEDVKDEVKSESQEEEEKVRVSQSPSDTKGNGIKEEIAEISSDEEEVEYLEPESLKKDLIQSEERQVYLCPVGSCTFSLKALHLAKQQQHFRQCHSQLDFSLLKFLQL